MPNLIIKLSIAAALSFVSFAPRGYCDDRILEVSPGIYRGPRANYDLLEELKNLGVRTIINLEDNDDEVHMERLILERLGGMTQIHAPLHWYLPPKESMVNRALEALANKELRPVYVHCQHGEDRTGMIIGLYRVEQENWSPDRAYSEMIDRGYHPEFIFMTHYFNERTEDWEP